MSGKEEDEAKKKFCKCTGKRKLPRSSTEPIKHGGKHSVSSCWSSMKKKNERQTSFWNTLARTFAGLFLCLIFFFAWHSFFSWYGDALSIQGLLCVHILLVGPSSATKSFNPEVSWWFVCSAVALEDLQSSMSVANNCLDCSLERSNGKDFQSSLVTSLNGVLDQISIKIPLWGVRRSSSMVFHKIGLLSTIPEDKVCGSRSIIPTMVGYRSIIVCEHRCILDDL